MLPEERRLQIVEQIRARPLVRADELAQRFGVSIETVRRDLDALQREGLVRRVYGGATGIVPRTSETPFDQRQALHPDRKQAIAALAVSLVQPEDTLILDVGTTVAELARALPAGWRGRVLTNSLLVAADLGARPEVEVEVSGGRVRVGEFSCSGSQAETFFAEFYADKAFLSCGGVHAQVGLTDYHPGEVSTRRVMINHAAELHVLADSSKLGQVALRKVCDLQQLTSVITDDQVDRSHARALERAGVKLLVAPTGERHQKTG